MTPPPRVLLDTHVLRVLVSTPQKVTPAAHKALAGTGVMVSAASAWEIAIKTRLGPPERGTAVVGLAWHHRRHDR